MEQQQPFSSGSPFLSFLSSRAPPSPGAIASAPASPVLLGSPPQPTSPGFPPSQPIPLPIQPRTQVQNDLYEVVETGVPEIKIYTYSADSPHLAQLHSQKILGDVYVRKDKLINYMKIRELYPDLYPSLEFELKLIVGIKERVSMIVNYGGNSGQRYGAKYSRLIEACNRLYVSDMLSTLLNYAHSSGEMSSRYGNYGSNNDSIAEATKLIETQRLRSSENTPFLRTAEWILAQYREAGFTWRYFMFYNEKSTAAQPGLGRIPITPDIFEAGAGSFPLDRYAQDWDFVATGRTIRNSRYPWSDPERGTRAPPFSAWNKYALLQAIVKSGLAVPFPGRGGIRGKKSVGIARASVNLPPKPRGQYRDYLSLSLEGYQKSKEEYESGDVHTNLFAYIALYRKLFNTLSYIDWSKAFQLGIVSPSKIYQMGAEFGLDSRMPPQEILSRIQEICTKRTCMAKEIAQLVPHQATAITYQPNSAWVRPVTRYQFADAGMTLTKPYEQFVFIRKVCEDDSIDKEQFLRKMEVAGMANMIPPNTDEYSKADLCEYLIETVGYQAQKYERLFFSCSDPDINIQSILNTLKTMELDFLVKNMDMQTITKEKLCEAVNNYLNLLLEAKGRDVARSSP